MVEVAVDMEVLVPCPGGGSGGGEGRARAVQSYWADVAEDGSSSGATPRVEGQGVGAVAFVLWRTTERAEQHAVGACLAQRQLQTLLLFNQPGKSSSKVSNCP